MVSLLIVAHSAQLANGVRELAEQVSGGKVAIGVAGGGPDGGLGVSVDQIIEALRQIANPDGVLILVDLKGAALSAAMALELIGELRVRFSDAPLVEGAYLAAIEASVGASLDEVAAAALQAREIHKLS